MDRRTGDEGLTRRRLLAGAAALGATAGAAALLRAPGRAVGDGVQSPPVQPFKVDLPIPRVAAPVHSDAVADYYEIHQRRADLEIIPGLSTGCGRTTARCQARRSWPARVAPSS